MYVLKISSLHLQDGLMCLIAERRGGLGEGNRGNSQKEEGQGDPMLRSGTRPGLLMKEAVDGKEKGVTD